MKHLKIFEANKDRYEELKEHVEDYFLEFIDNQSNDDYDPVFKYDDSVSIWIDLPVHGIKWKKTYNFDDIFNKEDQYYKKLSEIKKASNRLKSSYDNLIIEVEFFTSTEVGYPGLYLYFKFKD
jgi:hypothetical protein